MIQLDPHFLLEQPKLEFIRDGFGLGLVKAAHLDSRVLGLCADLTVSLRMDKFAQQFPQRFVNVGIAEQNMIGVAAGLAMEGFVPFAATYGVFMGRAWDQIRISVCLNNLNVKLVGSHSGVTVGEDGATAQAFEDIAMLRALPNLTIVCPCDVIEAEKATLAIAGMQGPAYLRLTREKSAVVTTIHSPFVIGRAEMLNPGKDVTVIACGEMVAEAMFAAISLKKQDITVRVINMHTIKPLDKEAVIAAARETSAIVVAEDHQVYGGLGGAVAEVLAKHLPIPMEQVAMQDVFGESGDPKQLQEKYGLTAKDIEKAVLKVLKRKTTK